MKTILYIANSAILGGGNKVLLDIVLNFNREKFSPYFFCPTQGPFTYELKKFNIPFKVIDPNILRAKVGKVKFVKFVFEEFIRFFNIKPDILHANCFLTYHSFSFIAWLYNIPRICHFHYPIKDIETIRWAFKIKPHVVIPCNQYLSKEVEPLIRKVVPNTKIIPISNAVDIEKYNLRDFDSNNFKKDLGILNDRVIITIIGHVSEVKGHKYFLEMIAGIKNNYPNILGLIVGEDKSPNKEYQKKMDSYVKELGIENYVKFLGFRKDIPEILAITDILVQPSLEEGLPLTILEAMAAGKAIITTPVGGVPEVIKDKETGLLVPVKDSKSLIEKVKFLLDNPGERRELSQKAKEFVRENYSLKQYVKKIEDIYLKLTTN